ncbi:MAG: hypothetical protein GXO90_08890 [FCB group bacterium]|nr:hypothetical protein [FCB group bacterium]
MKKYLKILNIILVLVFASGQTTGQSMQGAVGSVTLDGKVWNSLAFRPVIPIGKAALALDLVFYIDGEGNLHKDEWDFSDGTAIKNTLLDKIYYIRWGQPGDKLYLKVGALDRVSLGYGILVNGYSNTLFYPDVRKTGLEYGVKLNRFAVTGFVNDFKENISLTGIRIESSAFTGFPVAASAVLDRNQFLALRDRDGDGRPDVVDDFPNNSRYWLDSDHDGLADVDPLELDIDGDGITDTLDNRIPGWPLDTTIVLDTDIQTLPDPLNIQTTSDPVGALAFDVGFPLFSNKRYSVFLYAQAAKLIGETRNPETQAKEQLGSGLIPLGAGIRFGPLRVSLEYRMVPHGNFEFGYWSRTYDAERAVLSVSGSDKILITKESQLGKYGALKGIYGQAVINLINWFNISASYQNLAGENWNANLQSFETSNVESFLASVSLTKQVSKLKEARLYYQQQNVPNPFQFEFTENTVMGYRLGLEMGGGMVITYQMQKTFVDLNGDGDVNDRKEAVKHIVFETSFGF